MKIIDNFTQSVAADMAQEMDKGSRLSVAAACFSMFAFRELKEQLKDTAEFRFLFTSDDILQELRSGRKTGILDSAAGSVAESLAGTDLEKQIQNTLLQRGVARECAEWMRQGKVSFRMADKGTLSSGFAVVQPGSREKGALSYAPIQGFTASDLGIHSDQRNLSLVNQLDAPYSQQYLQLFNQVWRDQRDIKTVLLKQLEELCRENTPELVYYTALYHIFSEYLQDLNDDTLADDKTGFRNSIIWNKLFDFQKDAALAIINKLNRYNGCILADSVGLGKTFTALAVIKYYEARNLNVLVLCPKKLSDNWTTYTHNTKDNPLAADRFGYEVFYHTDLNRIHDTRARSHDVKLDSMNWGNFNLVVIDESHNFRNGGGRGDNENRYDRLVQDVIRTGVNTKVLMLSATPVNNRFSDLQRQLELAYEDGDPRSLERKLDSSSTIQGIFSHAQGAYNKWSNLKPAQRTTEKLLSMLDFDFFELLDSVTIARSRKHIREYYDMSRIGAFPTRMAPLSLAPTLTADPELGDYNFFFNGLLELELCIYTPSFYIQPASRPKYAAQLTGKRMNAAINQENRERGLRHLMAINLMKRMESSVESFRLTLSRMQNSIDAALAKLTAFRNNPAESRNFWYGSDDAVEIQEWDYEDEREENYLLAGKSVKIELADMDLDAWEKDLRKDLQTIRKLLDRARQIDAGKDNKLTALKDLISEKANAPLNRGNRKMLIFTAFADTADYLFDNLQKHCAQLGLNIGVVSGSGSGRTNVKGFPNDFSSILTCFSPESKSRNTLYPQGIMAETNIDVLIGTDCISEGQNLQDCDMCVNYDIHWNPIRIIQRYGRVDRIGSRNKRIRLVNFWPDASLDSYIDLKRRVENRMIAGFIVNPGEAKVFNDETEVELSYRKAQLEKLRTETVDLEDISESISITDLGMNEFRLDLMHFIKERKDLPKPRKGTYAVTFAEPGCPAGMIFVLKNTTSKTKIKSPNRLHPYYLVYVTMSGKVQYSYLQPKDTLLALKKLGREQSVVQDAVDLFHAEADDGSSISRCSKLLQKSVESIVEGKRETDIMSLFKSGTTSFNTKIEGMDDFEIICYMVVE